MGASCLLLDFNGTCVTWSLLKTYHRINNPSVLTADIHSHMHTFAQSLTRWHLFERWMHLRLFKENAIYFDYKQDPFILQRVPLDISTCMLYTQPHASIINRPWFIHDAVLTPYIPDHWLLTRHCEIWSWCVQINSYLGIRMVNTMVLRDHVSFLQF